IKGTIISTATKFVLNFSMALAFNLVCNCFSWVNNRKPKKSSRKMTFYKEKMETENHLYAIVAYILGTPQKHRNTREAPAYGAARQRILSCLYWLLDSI